MMTLLGGSTTSGKGTAGADSSCGVVTDPPRLNAHEVGRASLYAALHEPTSRSRAGATAYGLDCIRAQSHRPVARARSGRSALQPFRDKAIVGVDVDLTQRAGAGVDELVRGAGRSDHDLTSGHLDRLLADGEGGAPLLHQKDLGVRVPVQLRPAPGRTIEQDDA